MRFVHNGDRIVSKRDDARVITNDARTKAEYKALDQRVNEAMKTPEGLGDLHAETFVALQRAQESLNTASGRARTKAEKAVEDAQGDYNYVTFLVWDAAPGPGGEARETSQLAAINRRNAEYWEARG